MSILSVPPGLEVIFESDEMLVVNKPADIPMDGDLATYPRTVESMVSAHMKDRGIYDDAHQRLQQEGKRKKQLKFVHQLDYSTSGVLCLAFTKDMAARLAHCFEMRTTRKYYVALLHGHLPEDVLEKSASGASTAEVEDVTRASPFETWVADCNRAWHDIGGSVRVDACARRTAKENESAREEFCHLLRSSSDGGNDMAGQAAGDDSLPCVHRHCVSATAAESAAAADTLDDEVVAALLANSALGTPSSSSNCCLSIELPVGYDTTDAARFRMAVTTEQSRTASTSMLVLRRTHLCTPPHNTPVPVTLVLLSPHTGRRHQLRVHCRAVGFPIVGDTAYCVELPWCRPITGLSAALTQWQTPAARMYLHAWRLLLPGAVTAHVSEKDRVALKKKRRRETLGLSERSDAAVSAHVREWTEFIAPVHFPYIRVKGDAGPNVMGRA